MNPKTLGLRAFAPSVVCAFVALGVCACGGGTPKASYKSGDANSTPGAVRTWNFDQETAGSPPSDSAVFSGVWVVRGETAAPSPPNALCQTGRATFLALSLGDTIYKDVAVSVRFEPISGKEDGAGGIIFRVQDKDNYYITSSGQTPSRIT